MHESLVVAGLNTQLSCIRIAGARDRFEQSAFVERFHQLAVFVDRTITVLEWIMVELSGEGGRHTEHSNGREQVGRRRGERVWIVSLVLDENVESFQIDKKNKSKVTCLDLNNPFLISTLRFRVIGPRPYPTLPGICPKTYFSKRYTCNIWFESSLKKENFGTKHDSVSFEIKKLWAKNVQKTTVFSRFSIFGFFSLTHIKPILQDKNFKFGM